MSKSRLVTIVLFVAAVSWACAPEEPPVKSGTGEGGGTATGGGSAASSTGGAPQSATCAALCDKLAPICASDDDSMCGPTCQMREEGPCAAEWGGVAACLLKAETTLECKNDKPNSGDCVGEALLFASCEQNGGSTGQGGGSGGSCYVGGGDCNPMTDSCDPGETCDARESEFKCYSSPDGVPVGGSCGAPPYCAPGAFCDLYESHKCLKYCCTDDDCQAGQQCVPRLFILTLGMEILGCIDQ
jgi:hypothetical protein